MKTLRTCVNGHQYYKSSDCPVCPVCEQHRSHHNSFLMLLAAPARRALENAKILTLEQLATYTEQDILQLHGMGKSSIPKLRTALNKAGMDFKK